MTHPLVRTAGSAVQRCLPANFGHLYGNTAVPFRQHKSTSKDCYDTTIHQSRLNTRQQHHDYYNIATHKLAFSSMATLLDRIFVRLGTTKTRAQPWLNIAIIAGTGWNIWRDSSLMKENKSLIAQHDRDYRELEALKAQIDQHRAYHYRRLDERGIGYVDYRRQRHEPGCGVAAS